MSDLKRGAVSAVGARDTLDHPSAHAYLNDATAARPRASGSDRSRVLYPNQLAQVDKHRPLRNQSGTNVPVHPHQETKNERDGRKEVEMGNMGAKPSGNKRKYWQRTKAIEEASHLMSQQVRRPRTRRIIQSEQMTGLLASTTLKKSQPNQASKDTGSALVLRFLVSRQRLYISYRYSWLYPFIL